MLHADTFFRLYMRDMQAVRLCVPFAIVGQLCITRLSAPEIIPFDYTFSLSLSLSLVYVCLVVHFTERQKGVTIAR